MGINVHPYWNWAIRIESCARDHNTTSIVDLCVCISATEQWVLDFILFNYHPISATRVKDTAMNGSINQNKKNKNVTFPYPTVNRFNGSTSTTKSEKKRARIARRAIESVLSSGVNVQAESRQTRRRQNSTASKRRRTKRKLRQIRRDERQLGIVGQTTLSSSRRRRSVIAPPRSRGRKTAASVSANLGQIVRGGAQTIPNVGLTMPEKLALSVAMPNAGVLYRWPDLSEQPTALANPWSRQQVPAITGSNHQPFAAVFRNPLRAAVIYDANEAGSEYAYYGLARDDENTSLSDNFDLDASTTVVPLVIPVFEAINAYKPHGPRLFSGSVQDSDNYWFWVDSDLIVGGTVPSTKLWTVYVDFYLDGVIVEQVASTVITSATPTHTFSVGTDLQDSGYYSIRYSCTDNITACSIQLRGTDSVYCHLALPGLINNVVSALSFRMMGISLMYTNKSSFNDLGGSIVGMQVPAQLEWQNYVTFDQVNELQGSDTRDARHGMYGYIKPADVTDFKFLTQDEYFLKLDAAGNVLDCSYPLMSHRPFLVMTTNLTPAQTSGYWTYGFSIEYQTTDVWREIASPNLSTQEGDLALSVLKEMDQFHENTTHIKKLLDNVIKYVGKGLDVTTKYGPQLAQLMRFFF